MFSEKLQNDSGPGLLVGFTFRLTRIVRRSFSAPQTPDLLIALS